MSYWNDGGGVSYGSRGSLRESLNDVAQRWESEKERELRSIRSQLSTANDRANKLAAEKRADAVRVTELETELKALNTKLAAEKTSSQSVAAELKDARLRELGANLLIADLAALIRDDGKVELGALTRVLSRVGQHVAHPQLVRLGAVARD